MMEKVLQEIGLTISETKVYLTLLPLEKSGVSGLANKTNIHRNVVRKVCLSLKKKKLLKEEKIKNTFYYRTASPDRLKEILLEKENTIQRHKRQIEKYIPKLKAIKDPSYIMPQIQYFQGIEGMKTVYEDILHQGQHVYCWTNFSEKSTLFDTEYIKNYIKRRIEKKIQVFAIQSRNDLAEHTFDIFHQLDCENIIIDDLFLNNGEIRVYANKIAFICFEDPKEIKSYVMENNQMALMLKMILKSHIKLAKRR